MDQLRIIKENTIPPIKKACTKLIMQAYISVLRKF